MVFGRIASIGLDQRNYGKHSLHRTKAAQIYRRTGNLHAVQLLLRQILALRRLTISEDAEVRRGPRSTAGSADTGYFLSEKCSMREPLKMLLTIRVSPFTRGCQQVHRGWRSRRDTLSVGSYSPEGGRIDVR